MIREYKQVKSDENMYLSIVEKEGKSVSKFWFRMKEDETKEQAIERYEQTQKDN